MGNYVTCETFTDEEIRAMIADLRKQTTASLELLQALFEMGQSATQGRRS